MVGRVCFCSALPLPPLFSFPFAHGTAEILNESLLMKATSRALLSAAFLTGRGEKQGEEEEEKEMEEEAAKRKIARRFSAAVLRASSSTHTHTHTHRPRFSRSCISFFFFHLNSLHASELPAAKNEIPRSRQKFSFPRAAIVIALKQVWRNVLALTFRF